MTDEQKQLVKLARQHARGHSFYSDNAIVMSPIALRSLLQAVADASYEQAADECQAKHANGNWKYDYRDECVVAVRNLKGTLPEI